MEQGARLKADIFREETQEVNPPMHDPTSVAGHSVGVIGGTLSVFFALKGLRPKSKEDQP